MLLRSSSVNNAALPTVSQRCPGCGQIGTFDRIGQAIEIQDRQGVFRLGLTRCPKPDCRALVWVIQDSSGVTKATFPPVTIDYDATNVPASINTALKEAIVCHANQCYVAAAIMVRKTLEELCHERQASGGNLKERIRALGTKVVIPSELLDGLDDLRLLGNDAAHIESKEFDNIGKEEVEIGIEFAKEVLKAVYQYSALLARLRALKKTP